MNQLSHARRSRLQRTLTFPATGDRTKIWNQLTDTQRHECRIAIRQLLQQVVLGERDARRDVVPDLKSLVRRNS